MLSIFKACIHLEKKLENKRTKYKEVIALLAVWFTRTIYKNENKRNREGKHKNISKRCKAHNICSKDTYRTE